MITWFPSNPIIPAMFLVWRVACGQNIDSLISYIISPEVSAEANRKSVSYKLYFSNCLYVPLHNLLCHLFIVAMILSIFIHVWSWCVMHTTQCGACIVVMVHIYAYEERDREKKRERTTSADADL